MGERWMRCTIWFSWFLCSWWGASPASGRQNISPQGGAQYCNQFKRPCLNFSMKFEVKTSCSCIADVVLLSMPGLQGGVGSIWSRCMASRWGQTEGSWLCIYRSDISTGPGSQASVFAPFFWPDKAAAAWTGSTPVSHPLLPPPPLGILSHSFYSCTGSSIPT